MSVTPKNAYLAQVPAANTTLYTCPVNTTARIIKCSGCNATTTAQTITFHKVESGGSVADGRQIYNAYPIGNKETIGFHEMVGQVLEAGDFISAIAGGASQITVSLDVVEIV